MNELLNPEIWKNLSSWMEGQLLMFMIMMDFLPLHPDHVLRRMTAAAVVTSLCIYIIEMSINPLQAKLVRTK